VYKEVGVDWTHIDPHQDRNQWRTVVNVTVLRAFIFALIQYVCA
jgi:hypothetical protein